jgi:hypothetical protein
MNKARNLSVTNGLSGVNAASLVVEAICTWLDSSADHRKVKTLSPFGIYLKHATNPSPLLSNLQRECDGGKYVTWIGYETGENDTATRAVWLYSRDQTKRDVILEQIKSHFPEAEACDDDTDAGPAVVVNDAKGDSTVKDLAWFQSVLAAGGATSS